MHHIRGRLTDITGGETELTEALCGDIRTDSQCVEDVNSFNFGGMYVGTMECSLDLPYSMKDELKGGTITLDFGAETSAGVEWIPLGVWTVTECSRDSSDRIRLTGTDSLDRLRVATEPEKKQFVGVVMVYKLMEHVTKLTGVQFAQTIAELEELSGLNLGHWWATHYGETAWHEVKSIAQLFGCFAFANREGKIEFRRLDRTTPALEIGADRRHSAQLEEYTYSVRGVKYTDSYGQTVTLTEGFACAEKYGYRDEDSQSDDTYCEVRRRSLSGFGGASDSGAILSFSDCLLVWETADDPNAMYTRYLDNIRPNLLGVEFTPGTVDYYGNPALDVGDYVKISGGAAMHSGAVPFLICCNSWQFRGPQTLTASGFSEVGSGGSSQSISREAEQLRTVNITKSVKFIAADVSPGELFDSERTVAQADFSVKTQTYCFLECSLTVYGTEVGTALLRTYINGELQAFQPIFTVREGEYITQHFSLPLNAEGGSHSVRISASGVGNVEQLSAYVWGQNIVEISTEPTGSDDYIYEVSDGKTKIIYYVGNSTVPEIPANLGEAPVTKIGVTAFSYSGVTNVYIPEGVTEIE